MDNEILLDIYFLDLIYLIIDNIEDTTLTFLYSLYSMTLNTELIYPSLLSLFLTLYHPPLSSLYLLTSSSSLYILSPTPSFPAPLYPYFYDQCTPHPITILHSYSPLYSQILQIVQTNKRNHPIKRCIRHVHCMLT